MGGGGGVSAATDIQGREWRTVERTWKKTLNGFVLREGSCFSESEHNSRIVFEVAYLEGVLAPGNTW